MEDARKEFSLDIGDGVLSGLHASIRPGRWWRVIAPDGSLWCETSSEDEAREEMRPGDRLERWFGGPPSPSAVFKPRMDEKRRKELLSAWRAFVRDAARMSKSLRKFRALER